MFTLKTMLFALECYMQKWKIVMDSLRLLCKHTLLTFIIQSTHHIPFTPFIDTLKMVYLHMDRPHSLATPHISYVEHTQSKQRAFHSLLSLKDAVTETDLVIIKIRERVEKMVMAFLTL